MERGTIGVDQRDATAGAQDASHLPNGDLRIGNPLQRALGPDGVERALGLVQGHYITETTTNVEERIALRKAEALSISRVHERRPNGHHDWNSPARGTQPHESSRLRDRAVFGYFRFKSSTSA